VFVVVAAIALAAANGSSKATAAGAPQPDLKPQTITPAGFGHFAGDVRHIPQGNLVRSEERPEPQSPNDNPPSTQTGDPVTQTTGITTSAPTSGTSFQGLDYTNWGAGWPPDPNSDVGPNNIVETVNTSIGIFSKTGAQQAAMTFDSLFSAANTGTPCDNSNQGDPVALYDPIGDRFIVSDFAWSSYSTGPFYQCMAVSKTGDPVSGGWYFYAWKVENGSSLPDYPKLGVWPDGIYMSANLFSSTGSGSFQNVQVWAFNRQQMEAGNPSPQGVTFSLPRSVGGVTIFSLLPSNTRVVTGLPPAGSPNYFASIYGSYAIRTWKFHVDWTTPANSTFTGPTNTGIATFNVGPSNVPEKSPGNNIDTLSYRLMMQNQYTNIGGRESLWLTHTVGNGGSPNVAQVRWYELPVTGGTIGSVRQQSTYAPDSKNRFMPSLAVDKNGDMAIGYSVSDSTMYPALRYSGRLAGDALSTLTQSETTLVQGLGYQCCTFSDGSTNTRWGDYSAMTIDPDGCTFWYTGEYYDAHPTTKLEDDWLTRVGSFTLPGCGGTTTASPTISTVSPNNGPVGTAVTITGTNLAGASVTFGGVAATVTSNDGSTIQTSVPSGTPTGSVTLAVSTAGGTATSTFTVTVSSSSGPTIGSVSPSNGPVGTTVTITGTNLRGSDNANATVTFAGVSATVTSDNGTSIVTKVPTGAPVGNGTLAVTTVDGTATSSFRVSKK
jgi:hypothetical protein